MAEKFTPTEGKAIQAYLERGFRLLMRNGPRIEFQDKVTGDFESHSIGELISWYKEGKKDATRQAREAKKREEQGKRRYG